MGINSRERIILMSAFSVNPDLKTGIGKKEEYPAKLGIKCIDDSGLVHLRRGRSGQRHCRQRGGLDRHGNASTGVADFRTPSGNSALQWLNMEITGPMEWVSDKSPWLVSLQATWTIQEAIEVAASGIDTRLKLDRPPYYYWARFARSYADGRVACEKEEPGAYISGTEQVTGIWERKMYASPDARHCVAVWLRGEAD